MVEILLSELGIYYEKSEINEELFTFFYKVHYNQRKSDSNNDQEKLLEKHQAIDNDILYRLLFVDHKTTSLFEVNIWTRLVFFFLANFRRDYLAHMEQSFKIKVGRFVSSILRRLTDSDVKEYADQPTEDECTVEQPSLDLSMYCFCDIERYIAEYTQSMLISYQ